MSTSARRSYQLVPAGCPDASAHRILSADCTRVYPDCRRWRRQLGTLTGGYILVRSEHDEADARLVLARHRVGTTIDLSPGLTDLYSRLSPQAANPRTRVS